MAKVRATVIKQEGKCGAGHKVGDEIVFDWDSNEIIGKVCLHVLYSMLPKIYAIAHGADVAYTKKGDGTRVATHACPDGFNPTIFELTKE